MVYLDFHDLLAFLDGKRNCAKWTFDILVADAHQAITGAVDITEAEADNVLIVCVHLDICQARIFTNSVNTFVLMLVAVLWAFHTIVHSKADASKPFASVVANCA